MLNIPQLSPTTGRKGSVNHAMAFKGFFLEVTYIGMHSHCLPKKLISKGLSLCLNFIVGTNYMLLPIRGLYIPTHFHPTVGQVYFPHFIDIRLGQLNKSRSDRGHICAETLELYNFLIAVDFPLS